MRRKPLLCLGQAFGKALCAASWAALAATPAMAGPPRNAYEQGALDTVQAHVNVYRAWDLDAFVATFAHDAVVMLDGRTATGHAEIRALYASNFASAPHTIQIIESGMRKGMVYLTISYAFEDGYERCCSYAEYFVKEGHIAFLTVTMSNRQKRVVRQQKP